jgi:hypothetical protein
MGDQELPKDARFFLDQGEPEIDDPAEQPAANRWGAGDSITAKLVRSLEALRDLKTSLRALASPDVALSDKRALKQIITPVYNFAMSLRDLFNDINSNALSRLTLEEQRQLVEQFDEFGQHVPTIFGSPLKEARDKITAHLDKKASASELRNLWDGFDIAAILGWIRHCLRMLGPLLAADVYTWRRNGGSNIMRFEGREVHLCDDPSHGLIFGAITLTETPRRAIAREAEQVCVAWADVWRKYGLPLPEEEGQ